jgi:hypothetical protein
MSEPGHTRDLTGRRVFLSRIAAATAGAALTATATGAAQQAPAAAPSALPTIALGPHRVTRLIAGWNPIGGYSYLGHHMDQHMREYFTVVRTVQFLLDCERAGITAHQFSGAEKTAEILRTARERGSTMRFICLHAGREGIKDTIAATAPIAMAHHGGVTDRLFAEGKAEEVNDYVKQAHDCGVLAGVSAHNPACIRRIADEGWDVDFFMACFYFLTRPTDAPEAAAPPATLPIGYHFYADDPLAMTRVIREVKQPCLGFKILGAGRTCANQGTVREAFRFAFANMKPADGVIVGMYPRFFDEIGANAGYAREFAATA